MKRTRTPLIALLAVIVVTVAGVAAAVGSAGSSPSTTVRLSAKAGPVKMHGTLTLALAPVTGAQALKKLGALSSCTVQHTSGPRTGIADKLVCTNAAGQKVTVNAAPTSATLTYNLTSTVSLSSALLEIRHGTNVLFVLNAGGGTLAVSLSQAAALMNGHDSLYVQVGGHTYHGPITRVA